MFTFSRADRAGIILAELQAIDPVAMANDRDRAARAYVIAVLATVPANFGVIVSADNDDLTHMNVQIRHFPFGSYAN